MGETRFPYVKFWHGRDWCRGRGYRVEVRWSPDHKAAEGQCVYRHHFAIWPLVHFIWRQRIVPRVGIITYPVGVYRARHDWHTSYFWTTVMVLLVVAQTWFVFYGYPLMFGFVK